MSRKEARETVFKLVYERCVTGESSGFSFDLLTEGFFDDDLAYMEKVYDGIGEHNYFLNETIRRYSKAFKLDRVYRVDLAALLVAAYEILFFDDIPYQISVNEAVELSKKYSTEKSYRFINGILSSVVSDRDALKAELLEGGGGRGAGEPKDEEADKSGEEGEEIF
ncbi:MAG: transcription antitermination factor NusB [Firmicutes bacterium]|nr:transcription antitermination factor NusB [Bacillota bacterium]